MPSRAGVLAWSQDWLNGRATGDWWVSCLKVGPVLSHVTGAMSLPSKAFWQAHSCTVMSFVLQEDGAGGLGESCRGGQTSGS